MELTPRNQRGSYYSSIYNRKGKITHHELGKALSLSRYETDGVLKQHDVPIDLSIEELRAETDFLEQKSRE